MIIQWLGLGITYDLGAWKWNLDRRSWSILVSELAQVEEDRKINMKEAEIIMENSICIQSWSPGE